MRNLKTIEGKVKAILEKDEEARNDDMLLYLKVCNTCLKDTGAMPFAEVMLQYRYLGLPSIEKCGQDTAEAASGVSRAYGKQSCSEAPCRRRKGVPQVRQRMRGAYERRKTHKRRL